MPKTDIDYSTTIIYKITCKSPDVNEVYVGHTTNFVQRKYAHKQSCINTKTTNYNCKLYQVIRQHNGWDNWNMEIVNFFNCKDSYEARQKEQEYFVLLKATLNSIEPLPLPKPNNVTINVKECKEKKIYHCEHCNTRCSSEDSFTKHNDTKKHKAILSGKRAPTEALHIKNSNIFVCESCDFKCCRQSEYSRHIETNKHKMLTDANKKTPNIETNSFVCICGNKYNHKSSFSRHKRSCLIYKSSKEECENNETNYDDAIGDNIEETSKDIDEDILCSDSKNTITKHMFMELINDNKEMMKIIKEQQDQIKKQQEQIITIIPKIGNTTNNTTNNTMNNTTNNFNLNVFLNEKCKDALNISDFIDSLKITLDDLLFSKKNGISRGITDVMIKGLKELDVYKRPIHCTDTKRDTMYIKDENKWHKDENHDKMKNTIVKIADKERTALQQWANDNPDWIETESKQIEYLTMVRSICEPIENYDNYERKIIKNVGKEIFVDKRTSEISL